MEEALFVTGLGVGFLSLVTWGWRTLPDEGWQFLASVPTGKPQDDCWHGVNFTYYGVLIATAFVMATAMMCLLMAAAHLPVSSTLTVVLPIIAICVPASKLVARLVEHKRHTSTSGGASFVGILLAPWVIALTNATIGSLTHVHIPIMVALAALAVCYTLGEGLGRIACISFGCCYGKPLSQMSPRLQHLFDKVSFVFTGKTKKIAYASGLEGQKVVPIQALTSALYLSAGLLATLLFLHSHYATAWLVAMLTTQIWRPLSEVWRADYRGAGQVSAYQIMGLCAIPYTVALAWLYAATPVPAAHLMTGLQALWNPLLVVVLEALWAGIFVYYGRSTVTESTLSFHVRSEEI